MANVLTVRETVQRAKAEGLPISEYCLRLWIKQGKIPVRNIGSKLLVYWPNVEAFLTCSAGSDNATGV